MSRGEVILILLFLSPLIMVGSYILAGEVADPLEEFHEKFRLTQLKSTAKREKSAEFKAMGLRRRKISIWYLGATAFLAVIGASSTSLLLLLLVLAVYRYWEKGSLQRKTKANQAQAESEFPALIELYTILVSSGESPAVALEMILNRTTGQLSLELGQVVESMRGGKNLSQSLEGLAFKTNSKIIRRFCDTLILAMQRGTPLAEILQGHVKEVRQQDHAAMLAAAGKAEVALMIPVIFLILPISVLFALWPSYLTLGQGVG